MTQSNYYGMFVKSCWGLVYGCGDGEGGRLVSYIFVTYLRGQPFLLPI